MIDNNPNLKNRRNNNDTNNKDEILWYGLNSCYQIKGKKNTRKQT